MLETYGHLMSSPVLKDLLETDPPGINAEDWFMTKMIRPLFDLSAKLKSGYKESKLVKV
jgi:hypothetical protein